MHVLGLVFFLAAFLLAAAVIVQMLVANSPRIIDALRGEMAETETRPPAQIYHFPIRQPIKIEWREAA